MESQLSQKGELGRSIFVKLRMLKMRVIKHSNNKLFENLIIPAA